MSLLSGALASGDELPGWAPSVRDVALMRRNRMKGGQLGATDLLTFDETTNPTVDVVEGFIEIAVREVQSHVGNPDNTYVQASARDAASLYACMLIELSALSEQAVADRSPYDRFEKLYDDKIKRVVASAQEALQGGAPDQSDNVGLPTHTFDRCRLASGEPT